MHPLRNGSQVTVRPARKPVQGTSGYFSESNDENAPSYPGQDWFNDVIDEAMNLYAAAGITFDPDNLNNMVNAIAAYSKLTVYDDMVGLILPDSLNLVSRERAYLADGSEYNRADYPKLWSQVENSPILVSQALIEFDPEQYAANYGDGDGATTFTVPNYTLRPHLAVAGAFGAVGSTVEDQAQAIVGSVNGASVSGGTRLFRNGTGVFSVGTLLSNFIITNAAQGSATDPSFYASDTLGINTSATNRTGTYNEVNSSFLNFYIIHGETA